MQIETPDMGMADAIADCWVALAREQYQYGSTLLAEENREVIRENVRGHVVTDSVLIARERAESTHTASAEPDWDGLLGFVTFAPESGRYEQSVSRGTIENLYVRPDYRGRGIGSDLLEAAEGELSAADIEVVTLEAMTGNEAAGRFYHRHGYSSHRIERSKALESDTHK